MFDGGARSALLLLFVGCLATGAYAADECGDVSDDEGYVIRRSYVEGWWPLDIDLPTGPYSVAKESEALDRVKDARGKQSRPDAELLGAGAVSVVFTDTCLHVIDP